MRVSLKQLVFVGPLVAAVVFAIYSFHLRQQQEFWVSHYREAIDEGRHADPDVLFKTLGRDRCKAFLNSIGDKRDIQFDGSDRWCQIVRVPNTHGVGQGDEFTLFSLEDGFLRTRTLPLGAVLKSITFEDNDVVFSIYGEIDYVLNEEKLTIPKSDPVVYRFLWKPGTRPPEADLNMLLYEEPRVKSTVAP